MVGLSGLNIKKSYMNNNTKIFSYTSLPYSVLSHDIRDEVFLLIVVLHHSFQP